MKIKVTSNLLKIIGLTTASVVAVGTISGVLIYQSVNKDKKPVTSSFVTSEVISGTPTTDRVTTTSSIVTTSDVVSSVTSNDITTNVTGNTPTTVAPTTSVNTIDPNEGLQEEKNYLIGKLRTEFAKYDMNKYSPKQQEKLNTILQDEIDYINSLSNHEEVRAYSMDSFEKKLKDVKTLDTLVSNDIFMSEIYHIKNSAYTPTGGSNDKAIEFYNPLDQDINLSSYSIKIYSSGLKAPKDDNYIVSLSGTIKAHQTYTYVHNYAQEWLRKKGDNADSLLFFNEKSAIGLYKNDTLIDIFGEIGKDFSTNEGTLIGDEVALNCHNVIRKPGYVATSEFIEDQWEVHTYTDGSSLQYHKFEEADDNVKEALNNMVNIWSGNFTGDFANMAKYYSEDENYKYIFNFDNVSYFFNKDGSKKSNEIYSDEFIVSIGIKICDKEGHQLEDEVYLEETYYRTKDYKYTEPLEDIIGCITGEIITSENTLSQLLKEVDELSEYSLSYVFDSRYYDSEGNMIKAPEDGEQIFLGVNILDEEGNVALTSFETYLLYEA